MVSEVQQCINEHPNANGLVVIFTNDYKDTIPSDSADKLEALEECHTDGLEMKKTFCDDFGFACLWKKNCTAAQTSRVMELMGRCVYLPSYKCLAVVFSGHGKANVLLGNDGNVISIEEEVIGPLQPGELPQMRKVPKLVFIDACRGEQEMPAWKNKEPRKREMITREKKMGPRGVAKGGCFVAYATTLGYRTFTCGNRSRWLPRVAHKLKISDECVQEIVAEVCEELRMDTNDVQCPVYEGSCGPVYLHQLIDNSEC